MEEFSVRKIKKGEEGAVLSLIQELADYEKEPNAVIVTPEQLAVDLFEDPICSCFVLLTENKIVGMALYYTSYSTWKGRCLYLEDLYIQPEYRQKGGGELLFNRLLEEARKSGVKRMDWQVLEWNKPAIAFYEKIGATLDPEWWNGRMHF